MEISKLNSNPVYFPGFNGIRAWAAFLVVFVHFNQFAFLFDITGFREHSDLAGLAVTVFFVLSGFLITYLLLSEYVKFGTIKLIHFYIRRILRIWPLYYLIILLTFVIYLFIDAPDKGNYKFSTFFYYLIFTPNVAYASNMVLIPITPLWSVGVEEQFYLLWPWLFKKKNSNIYILKLLLSFVVIFLVAKILLRYFDNGFWYSLIISTRLECMAIGGIAAWFIVNDVKTFRDIVFLNVLQYFAILFFVHAIIYAPFNFSGLFNHLIYSLFSIVIILNVGLNPNSVLKLENRVYNFLGKISYGFYCYHMLVILILSRFTAQWSFQDNLYNKVFLFVCIVLINLLLSFLSYNYFELRFIRMKDKFARIISRN